MKQLQLYQVDAFTEKTFGGNPAAVCPLDEWLSDDILQNIAAENNLSETAFFVPTEDGYHLRWFTPVDEVDLCGHATLAASYVIFEKLGHDSDMINFETTSGLLSVSKTENGFLLDFPVWTYEKIAFDLNLAEALGAPPIGLYKAEDYVALYDSAADVANLAPDMLKLAAFNNMRGLIATAPAEISSELDFVSRAFFPRLGIPEDPVTGSAHCVLTPIWAKRLNKTTLKARQISKRGGDLVCALKDNRVKISGKAALYLKGTIYV